MGVTDAFARLLVDELARCGVTDACLAPGGRSTPLVLAFDADPRIRLHVGIDERSAAFLALGQGRATRRPAAVVSTSGTAAVNFHPAVVEADAARVPLLVLTADRPPELRHTGANQTIDQVRLYGGAVRWSVDVGVPEDRPGAAAYWRSLACRAVAGAADGPVHLNLPFREPLVPTDEPVAADLEGRPGGEPWTAVTRAPRVPTAAQVDDLARRVAAAPRGLLVAGDADLDPRPVLDLAEHLGWPVVAEPLSGLRRGPNAIATADTLLRDGAFAAAHRPDLVLRVGRVNLSTTLLGWLSADVPQALVDRHGAWLDPTRAVGTLVEADPEPLAALLVDAVPAAGDRGWLDGWREADAAGRAAVDAVLDADDRPSEPRTARDVAAAVPDGGVLVAASSMPVRDLDRFMWPRAVDVVANRGASGIDGFVSTALGVALHRPTVALAGDLSLLHDANGLLLDDREEAALVLVVVNNDGGGIFSFLPQASQPGALRLFTTPHGVDLERLAAVHGLWYERVERARDLPAAVEPRRGVALVEVRTDRDENVALHDRLTTAALSALSHLRA